MVTVLAVHRVPPADRALHVEILATVERDRTLIVGAGTVGLPILPQGRGRTVVRPKHSGALTKLRFASGTYLQAACYSAEGDQELAAGVENGASS
jgi:hypothetical protein